MLLLVLVLLLCNYVLLSPAGDHGGHEQPRAVYVRVVRPRVRVTAGPGATAVRRSHGQATLA